MINQRTGQIQQFNPNAFGFPPGRSLFLGTFLLMSCFLLSGAILQLLATWIVGADHWRELLMGQETESDPGFFAFRWLQGLSNLLTWGIAGIIWIRLNGSFSTLSGFSQKPGMLLMIIAPLIMILSLPLVQAFMISPDKFSLPESMSGLTEWIKESEGSRMALIQNMLGDTSVTALLMNLFVLGLIPAFAEEIFFRGALQKNLQRVMNDHGAVWLTAFIFSFLHFQFLGFIPRLLLGALLGYFYLRTGSLWVSFGAHFLHNSFNLVLGWLSFRGNLPEEIARPEYQFNWSMVGISAILTGVLIFWFWKRSDNQEVAVSNAE